MLRRWRWLRPTVAVVVVAAVGVAAGVRGVVVVGGVLLTTAGG